MSTLAHDDGLSWTNCVYFDRVRQGGVDPSSGHGIEWPEVERGRAEKSERRGRRAVTVLTRWLSGGRGIFEVLQRPIIDINACSNRAEPWCAQIKYDNNHRSPNCCQQRRKDVGFLASDTKLIS